MLAVTQGTAKRMLTRIKKIGADKFIESQEYTETPSDVDWPHDDDDDKRSISTSPDPTPLKKRRVSITKWLLLQELSDTHHAPILKGVQLDTHQGFWNGFVVSIRKW
jgi:hypothetical protein